MLALCCRCVPALSSCGEQVLLSNWDSPAPHGGSCSCCTAQALGCVCFSSCTHELSSCGSQVIVRGRLGSCDVQAYLPRGMCTLPGPGISTVSVALAGS